MNNLRSTLRRLSRRFGTSIDYYQDGDLVIDEVAGTATSSLTKTTLDKAIELTGVLTRDVRGNFTLDAHTTKFYIPNPSVEITRDNYITTVSQRYRVLKVHKLFGDVIAEVVEYEGDSPLLIEDVFHFVQMNMRCDVS